jgi:hypothetical protein
MYRIKGEIVETQGMNAIINVTPQELAQQMAMQDVRIYGYKLSELKRIIDFANEHGYKGD